MRNYEKFIKLIIQPEKRADCSIYELRTGDKICDLECSECRKQNTEWAFKIYIEPNIISKDEYMLLSTFTIKSKFIGRDLIGNLYLCNENHDDVQNAIAFNNMFKFIKENEKYEINELILGYIERCGGTND